MATWALTTFTTLADLATIEEEILQLSSNATNSYTATAVNLATATDPIVTGVTKVDISNGKGITEIVGVVNTTGAIADGHSLTIKLYDSADDVTYAEIHAGQRVYYRAASGAGITLTAADELFRWVVPSDCEDYVKAVITSSASNTGKIDIYTISKLASKIALAKVFMGEDLERMLISAGYEVNESDDEILLDLINNKDLFNYCSHYLSLALIYEDEMTTGDETDIYKVKADRYYKRYKDKLSIVFPLKDIDTNEDGTTDIYKDGTVPVYRFRR